MSAQSDPFALLFGDGEPAVDAGETKQTGEDDLSIVRLRLNGFELVDALPAFDTEQGLCLPIQPVIDGLEFPIEVSEDRAEGWFVSDTRSVLIDFESGETRVAGHINTAGPGRFNRVPDGWCATLPALSETFGFDIDYRKRELTVDITPREILPIEARLERAAARSDLHDQDAGFGPDYDPVDNPYRWISMPVADIALTTNFSKAGTFDPSLSVDIAGDLLKMTGRLRTISGDQRMIEGIRFSLQRQDVEPGRISPLKARRFAIGDVSTPALPLLSRGQTGAGAVYSNRANFNADIFDTTEIRGVLPDRWEAELYSEDRLIAFITEPDANGDYVFDTVALRPGYNRLQVRLFGPYGETKIRDVRYFVGADLTPENETAYSIGFVNGNRSLVGDRERDEKTDFVIDAVKGAPKAFATVSHGLSEQVTVRFDGLIAGTANTDEPSGVAASVFGSVLDTYGAIRVSTVSGKSPAIQVSAQRQIGRLSGLSAQFTDFGGTENTVSGLDGARIEHAAAARLSSQFQFAGRVISTQSDVSWRDLTGGIDRFDAKLRTSGAVGRYRWTNSLRHRRVVGPEETTSETEGELLTSRNIGQTRIRAAIAYGLQDSVEPTTLSIGAQRVFGGHSATQLTFSRDLREQTSRASVAWSRKFRSFALTGSATLSETGDWSCGLGLSMSIFQDELNGKLALAQPGLSRSGAVRQTVYHDLNGNAQREVDEPAIEGVRFIVGNSLRPEETDANGHVIFDGVSADLPINIELQLSSLNDPFLKPVKVGRSVTVRAGQVVEIETPVQSTGDVEGILLLENGPVKAPISGVEIEIRDQGGLLVATTRTEFDGYFYIDGLPMGELVISVSDTALSKNGVTATPLSIAITPHSPSVFGAELLLQSLEDQASQINESKISLSG